MLGAHDFTKSHPRSRETISSGTKRGASSAAEVSSMELLSELSKRSASSKSYGNTNEKTLESFLITLIYARALTSMSISGKLNDLLKSETKNPMLGISDHD